MGGMAWDIRDLEAHSRADQPHAVVRATCLSRWPGQLDQCLRMPTRRFVGHRRRNESRRYEVHPARSVRPPDLARQRVSHYDHPELDAYLRPDDVAHAVRVVLKQPRFVRTTVWQLWSTQQS